MARPDTSSILAIIEDAVSDVVARVSGSVDRAVAERVAEELRMRPAASAKVRRILKRAGPVVRPRRAVEVNRWVADRRARRVPIFVIELTGGLDTKKKIVAKYGADVVFEKGRPAPKAA